MRSLLLVSLLLGTFAFRFQAQPLQDLDEWDDLELIFSHQNHLVEEGLLCEDCHLDVEESTTGVDNLLPEMETCGFCHDIEDLDNCGMCHENEDEPEEVPRIDDYSPKFSHQRHMEEADLECESCHAGVEEQTVPEATDLPDMLDCMDCHEDERVVAECLTCHLETERLVPTSHTADFMHGHGTLAQSEDLTDDEHMTCATCHSEAFCQECHEGDNLERFTHPLNYVFTHALDAQANEHQCATCHTDQQFCNDCHRDFQILPQSHSVGWVNGVTGGRHRNEAQADLGSCMACHEGNADIVCSPCHGGPGR